MHPSYRMNLYPKSSAIWWEDDGVQGSLWQVVWGVMFIKGANSVEIFAEIEGKTHFFPKEYLLGGPVLSCPCDCFLFSDPLYQPQL